MTDAGETAGWNAITQALEGVYGSQIPRHISPPKQRAEGADPLDGISIYDVKEPVPHWHYVTYGLTELYAKETDDPAVSGFGFELTLRLVRQPTDDGPPKFAIDFLQNLARHVFTSGRVFEAGAHVDFNGPISAGAETAITAGCFEVDPDLGEIATPHGSVTFLQIVGLTADELLAVKSWNTTSFTNLLKSKNPKLVTDLTRSSVMKDPAIRDQVVAGVEAEGSSTDVLLVENLSFEPKGETSEKHVWSVGALQVPSLRAILPGRIRHDRALVMMSKDCTVRLQPGESCSIETVDGGAAIELDAAACDALCHALAPQRGDYEVSEIPDLVVRVRPTSVRAPDGSVARTVG